ncbi:sensitivity to high expression protein she9, partial [Spiromyces aspiralis]
SLEKSRQSLEAQLRDLRAKLSDIFAIAKSESDDIPTRASRVVNYVTGYDRIQELRLVVDAAGSSFTAARGAADRTKRRYEQSVIDRANCQREINLLLQRKHLWTDSDVLNFTSLYKAEHQHEQAEIQAKEAVDAAEQDVNRKYDQLVDAIRERYHEEQLWSDKIRLVSSYATWAVLCLNILMIIVVQAYFEPKKRQKIVDGVEERLGARISSQMQDTSGTSLDRDWTKGITRSISEVSDKLATVLLALQQLVHNQAIYQQQQQQQQQSQPVESKVTSDNEKLLMLFQESLQEALRPYPLDGIGAADSTAASVIPPRLPSFSRK